MKNSQIFHTVQMMFWLILLGLTIQLQSCEEKEEVDPDGLTQAINDIVPDSTLNQMIALGMPINRGFNPPILDKIYKAAPFKLFKTNIPNDFAIGHTFANFKFRLYDYNSDNYSIKLDDKAGNSTGIGTGSFISGEGNKFTIFAKTFNTRTNGTKSDLLVVLSGEKTDDGIKDFYYSLYMLNDYGDPNDDLIENGDLRIIYDSDGLSPEVSSLDDLIGEIRKNAPSFLETNQSKKK